MSGRTPTYEELEQWEAIYREYFLASEENTSLNETVGISREQFDANQQRWQHALFLCQYLEERRQFG